MLSRVVHALARRLEESLTDRDVRNAYDSLRQGEGVFPATMGEVPHAPGYVVDVLVDEDCVIVSGGGRTFKVPYSTKDGRITFDESKRVEVTQRWVVREASPPGWSGTVKAMKKHADVENPFALAWDMYKKGATPHEPPEKDGREAEFDPAQRDKGPNTLMAKFAAMNRDAVARDSVRRADSFKGRSR